MCSRYSSLPSTYTRTRWVGTAGKCRYPHPYLLDMGGDFVTGGTESASNQRPYGGASKEGVKSVCPPPSLPSLSVLFLSCLPFTQFQDFQTFTWGLGDGGRQAGGQGRKRKWWMLREGNQKRRNPVCLSSTAGLESVGGR